MPGKLTVRAAIGLALLACGELGERAGRRDWQTSVERDLGAREYEASPNDVGLQAPNRAQNLRTYFDPEGIRVHDRTAEGSPRLLELALRRIGRERALESVPAGVVHVHGARVEIQRSGVLEWFENRPDGLEQGFTLAAKPEGDGPLLLELELDGARATPSGDGLVFQTSTGRRLDYGGLAAWDAGGSELAAEFRQSSDGRIAIAVHDAGARYPITIDPLLSDSADARLESDAPGAQLGVSVASAGDVNGDGYADVIVGAYLYDDGETDEGAAFVFLGTPAGVDDGNPASAHVQIASNQANAQLGWSVASAGDVNGDGYADVIVGAFSYSETGQAAEGAAFVFLGSASGIVASAPHARLEGDQAGAWMGYAVASAGDTNGDGFADVIVGAPSYDSPLVDEGVAFVFLGSPSGIVPDGSPAYADAWLDGNQDAARMGASVASAGDVNGDGFADVIVGADLYDGSAIDEGGAFVFLGGATGTPANGSPGSAHARLTSGQAGARMGASVGSAGDANGDGFADVVVGAPRYDNPQADEGAAFVFHGSSVGVVADGNPGNTNARLESNQADAWLGAAVGSGDATGDGYADVIAGAPNYDAGQTDEGAAFVFLGTPTGVGNGSPTSSYARFEGNQNAASAGASVGAGDTNGDGFADFLVGAYRYDAPEADEGAAFVLLGGGVGFGPILTADRTLSGPVGAFYAESVAGAGDVNGDGFSDVIVGAALYDAGQTDEGGAWVFLGSASGVATTAHAFLEGDQADARLGTSVASAGDVNGDGFGDVIVGAPRYDDPELDEGAAVVFLGSASGIVSPPLVHARLGSDSANAQMGTSVASAGDVNGDGFGDVIVGAPLYDDPEADEGAAFVFLGSETGLVSGGPGAAQIRIDGDQAGAQMGASVASAGDVNGDGFGDVIIGARTYDSPDADEGAAFVFLGSAAGIAYADPLSAHPRLESDQAGAQLGWSVAPAGDVNGDGFADVIVGAPKYDNLYPDEGVAFVFQGSATGIASANPATADSRFDPLGVGVNVGQSVASAGDVNGDGFADVIIGSPVYPETGAALVFLGSPSGTPANGTTLTAAKTFISQCGSPGNHRTGWSVASAGDVDGDGFADVIVGSPGCPSAEVHESGGRSVQFAPLTSGRLVLARQSQPGGSPGVGPWGGLPGTAFEVSLRATDPGGRGRVALETEWCPPGVPFGHLSCGRQASGWTDVTATANGVTLADTIGGLAPDTLYRWRARVLRAPFGVTQPGVTPPPSPPHGPWRRPAGLAVEADLRTGSGTPPADADGDGVPDSLDNCPGDPNPGQENLDGDALGNACDPDDDNDALTDADEAIVGTNPLNPDTDADSLSDGLEVNTLGTNPLNPDTDADARLDAADNCPLVPNASQIDVDADGRGDVCDNCRRTHNPGQENGGALNGVAPDLVGNHCQNGDWNADGTVDLLDLVLIRRHFAGLETLDPSLPPGP